jgi:hypothetical protein
VNAGEDCTEPLVTAQASERTIGGGYVWEVQPGQLSTDDGAIYCDPSGGSSDVVIEYTKLSGDTASGGQLMRIYVENLDSTSTARYPNIAVYQGGCGEDTVENLRCLWYKQNQETFMDVPAGDYQVWVQFNNPSGNGTTDRLQVTIEEVEPESAEGEGCFSPWTDESSIVTDGGGGERVYTIPATINGSEFGVSWGEGDGLTCDNAADYGDIHGVDTVIELNKPDDDSVLVLSLTNLASSLTSSDLNIEIFDTCSPSDLEASSRACSANSDNHTLTIGGAAGDRYVWISTEATSEEFGGAELTVETIFPDEGETRHNGSPITGSGTYTVSSGRRLDVPSCFGAGNISWLQYEATNEAVTVTPTTAGISVAVVDSHGAEVSCLVDADDIDAPRLVEPGETISIAVLLDNGSIALDIDDREYFGALGQASRLDYANAIGSASELVITDAEVFAASTSFLQLADRDEGSSFSNVSGVGAGQLGSGLVWSAGSLFGADTTTVTGNSRIYRLTVGSTPNVSAWDTPVPYPAGVRISSLAQYESTLYYTDRTNSGTATTVYSVPAGSGPTVPTEAASLDVYAAVGLAVSRSHSYVAANGDDGTGVYRVARTGGAATLLVPLTLTTTTLAAVTLDNPDAPEFLYARDATENIFVVVVPESSTPAGFTLPQSWARAGRGLFYDTLTNVLYAWMRDARDGHGLWRVD